MYILQESTHFTHFVAIYGFFHLTFGGSAQIITILHRGGLPDLLQYYIGRGGSTETPKMYYVIYERPLMRNCNFRNREDLRYSQPADLTSAAGCRL